MLSNLYCGPNTSVRGRECKQSAPITRSNRRSRSCSNWTRIQSALPRRRYCRQRCSRLIRSIYQTTSVRVRSVAASHNTCRSVRRMPLCRVRRLADPGRSQCASPVRDNRCDLSGRASPPLRKIVAEPPKVDHITTTPQGWGPLNDRELEAGHLQPICKRRARDSCAGNQDRSHEAELAPLIPA